MLNYVLVESDGRDKNLYPYGNSFTTYLTSPIKNVTRIDLLTARIPNTFYNYNSGDFILNDVPYSIPPGFYSSFGLTKIIASLTGLYCDYLTDQAKFMISSIGPFTITLTGDLITLMGNINGSSILSTGTYYQNMYPSLYILEGQNPVVLNAVRNVVLDIEELRNSTFLDAKKLTNSTYTGSVSKSLASIPIDVSSGQIKTFKERNDYTISAYFDTPIPSIKRFTIRWLDTDGNIVNFNGNDNNSFTLRVFSEPSKEPEPDTKETDMELLTTKIQRAVQDAIPPPKPEQPPRYWIYILLMIISGALVYWFTSRTKPELPAPLYSYRPPQPRV